MTVPWEDDAQQAQQLRDQAKQATDAGQYPRAATLYKQAYDLQPSAFYAARYIHCMRHQGPEQARAAVVFAREPVERWPNEVWLIREYVWAIYVGYLRAATDAADEDEETGEERHGFDIRVKAARRILKLSTEDLPRTRAVFAICREAKAHRQWPLVLEFALTLDRDKLSDEAQEQNGRVFPSNLQRWLYYVTRARLEVGDYDACLELAREGIERYPEVLFFPLWHALARVRQGNVEEGLLELQEVDRRFPRQWYVQRDIAETCEKLQRDEDAWRWFCDAARTPGALKGRIPMLAHMAQLLERMERLPSALDHLLLAWSLAALEPGWDRAADRYRQQLAEFEQRHSGEPGLRVTTSNAPPDPEPLLNACRDTWEETVRTGPQAVGVREGAVTPSPDDQTP